MNFQELAPDIILQHIPILGSQDIKLEEKIGEGGFATVWRGIKNHPFLLLV